MLPHHPRGLQVGLVVIRPETPDRFRGSALQITALAANEVDIAALSFSAFALAIQNARMNDIRAIADVFQDGIEGNFSIQSDSPCEPVTSPCGELIGAAEVGCGTSSAEPATWGRIKSTYR